MDLIITHLVKDPTFMDGVITSIVGYFGFVTFGAVLVIMSRKIRNLVKR